MTDWKRAKRVLTDLHENGVHTWPFERLEQEFATVRREALEAAAKVCDPFMRNEALSVRERDVAEWIHARIRALKDGAP